jgi:hypothetical protein
LITKTFPRRRTTWAPGRLFNERSELRTFMGGTFLLVPRTLRCRHDNSAALAIIPCRATRQPAARTAARERDEGADMSDAPPDRNDDDTPAEGDDHDDGPDFSSPGFSSPDFSSPAFTGPDSTAHEYTPPDYEVPAFEGPDYEAENADDLVPDQAGFTAPGFSSPDFSSPGPMGEDDETGTHPG